MKKTLKIVLIIMVILLVIGFIVFGISIAEKINIINNIERNLHTYLEKENIYLKKEGENSIIEYYKNENFYKQIIELKENDYIITEIASKEKQINLIETNGERKITEEKITEDAFEQKKNFMTDALKFDNVFEKVMYVLRIKVYDGELSKDGTTCYVIEGLYNPNIMYDENTKNSLMFFDKDTGLLLRVIEIMGDDDEKLSTIDYEYRFDEILDDEFVIKFDLL